MSPTGIEAFDLGLATGPAPTAWDGISIRLDDGGPGPSSLIVQIDRILALPEPSLLPAAMLGSLSLLAAARRSDRLRNPSRRPDA